MHQGKYGELLEKIRLLFNEDKNAAMSSVRRLIANEKIPIDGCFGLADEFHLIQEFDIAEAIISISADKFGFQRPFGSGHNRPLEGQNFAFYQSIQSFQAYNYYARVRSAECGGIDVYYTNDLMGGGQDFGQDYINVIAEKIGPVERIFEWCCGPAFIGFSLLGTGLCHSLCLADINPKAIEAVKHTLRRNDLTRNVDVYISDSLQSIPDNEKWDLVVGNPPMAGDQSQKFPGPQRLSIDTAWKAHRNFFGRLSSHLNTNGIAVIQEAKNLSTAETFVPLVENTSLEIFDVTDNRILDDIYYIWLRLKC